MRLRPGKFHLDRHRGLLFIFKPDSLLENLIKVTTLLKCVKYLKPQMRS
jgi:hypothetical protein